MTSARGLADRLSRRARFRRRISPDGWSRGSTSASTARGISARRTSFACSGGRSRRRGVRRRHARRARSPCSCSRRASRPSAAACSGRSRSASAAIIGHVQARCSCSGREAARASRRPAGSSSPSRRSRRSSALAVFGARALRSSGYVSLGSLASAATLAVAVAIMLRGRLAHRDRLRADRRVRVLDAPREHRAAAARRGDTAFGARGRGHLMRCAVHWRAARGAPRSPTCSRATGTTWRCGRTSPTSSSLGEHAAREHALPRGGDAARSAVAHARTRRERVRAAPSWWSSPRRRTCCASIARSAAPSVPRRCDARRGHQGHRARHARADDAT